MAKKTDHLHSYKKTNLGRKGNKFYVLKCTKSNCPHFIRYELAAGKTAECPKCHEPYVLDKLALTLATPHCINCTKYKEKTREAARSITSLVEDLGVDLHDIK